MAKPNRVRRLFKEHEIQMLSTNPNVIRVTEKSISYAPSFKMAAIQAHKAGSTPQEIFLAAGFNLDMIGSEIPGQCINRWNTVYQTLGESGLAEDRRGRGTGGGRPITRDLSSDEKLKRAEARIKLLEAENALLKKSEALDRPKCNELTTSERFELINHVIREFQLQRLTLYFCQLLCVSKSGYYRWLHATEYRQQAEERDYHDYLIIKSQFDRLNGKAGALTIKMHLNGQNGLIMNHKKIRRIMRKFRLATKVRRSDPYAKMAKATQEHRTCPNHLDRQFDQTEPEKVFLTDITYLKYGNGNWAYLSCVKDCATRQILAFHVSDSIDLNLVGRTIDRLLERLKDNIHPEAIFHSDQGFHYTHPRIQQRIQSIGMIQSMSRRGNCWDNAPMESFFGHMKDEMDYRDCKDIAELKVRVNQYILFYNTERYQWNLKQMTPDEYRSHLLSA